MAETEQCCEVCKEASCEKCVELVNSSEDFSDSQISQGIWPDDEY